MGTGSFPGIKREVDHSPPSSAEVKERVELYLYSPSGSSWPVPEWTLLSVPLKLGIEFILAYIEIWWKFTWHGGGEERTLVVGLSHGKRTEVFWRLHNRKDSTIYVHCDVETYRLVNENFSRIYSPRILGAWPWYVTTVLWYLTAYQSTRRNNVENVKSSAAQLWGSQALDILSLLMKEAFVVTSCEMGNEPLEPTHVRVRHRTTETPPVSQGRTKVYYSLRLLFDSIMKFV